MTLAKWLNTIGPDDITTEAILEQMAAFEGPLILGSPVVDCGKYPEAPGTAVTTRSSTGSPKMGAFEKVSGFLPPPEGWEYPSGVAPR